MNKTRLLKFIIILFLMKSPGFVTVVAQSDLEVLEYYPAPGQFINLTGIGSPQDAFSLENGKKGLVCLGSFGGYITLKLVEPIQNDVLNPYGIDFVIFGNAATDFAEPAIVQVMDDKNQNGLPDDEWFEIAGSDHYFQSTRQDYSIRYFDPGEDFAKDVIWKDVNGKSGFVFTNTFHDQSYYPAASFDQDFYADSCFFSGTKIQGRVDRTNPSSIKSAKRAFGYADNQPAGDLSSDLPDNPYTPEVEGMGGDPFDISWARDKDGEYAVLTKIDFLRIHSAVLDNFGNLGEVSPEIRYIKDIAPSPGTSGEGRLLIIEDLPPEILPGSYQLFVHYFENGIPADAGMTTWSIKEGTGNLNNQGLLEVNQTGKLIVKVESGDLIAEMETMVVNKLTRIVDTNPVRIRLYPNPFSDNIMVETEMDGHAVLYNASGKNISEFELKTGVNPLQLSNLNSGLYFLKVQSGHTRTTKKIIKIH